MDKRVEVELDKVMEATRYGHARLTFVRMNVRHTYSFTAPKDVDPADGPWFVKVLSPSGAGERAWKFIGTIFPDSRGGHFRYSSRKAALEASDHRVGFFVGAWEVLRGCPTGPTDKLRVWNEGTCWRCGRGLTTPESIARCIGPECLKKGGGR